MPICLDNQPWTIPPPFFLFLLARLLGNSLIPPCPVEMVPCPWRSVRAQRLRRASVRVRGQISAFSALF